MKHAFAIVAVLAVVALIAYKSGLFSAGITLTEIRPNVARPGQTVVLGGIGLDSAPDQTVVVFDGVSVRPQQVGTNSITVTVPPGARSGLVSVVAGTAISNQRFIQIEGGDGALPAGHPPMGGGMMPQAAGGGMQQANPHGGAMGGSSGDAGAAHQFWQPDEAKDYIDFTLKDAQGNDVKLSEQIGSIVLVNFWATWCKPCLEEVPSLERLTARAPKLGLKVLAVSVDKSFAEIEKALPDTKLNVVLDPGGEVAERYGTVKFPETWVIDKSGKIVARFIGSRNWDSPVFVKFFEVLSQQGLPEAE